MTEELFQCLPAYSKSCWLYCLAYVQIMGRIMEHQNQKITIPVSENYSSYFLLIALFCLIVPHSATGLVVRELRSQSFLSDQNEFRWIKFSLITLNCIFIEIILFKQKSRTLFQSSGLPHR